MEAGVRGKCNIGSLAFVSVITADVVVVGAGPAGSAAAITLGRAGRSVLLIDKADFPRDKCCGDGLTTLALRELEPLGFQPSMVVDFQPVHAAWLRSPSGREVCVPLPDDGLYAATAPRRQFDAALVQRARDAGVAVHTGVTFSAVRTVRDHVDVDVDGLGSVRARYVIAADGMWSPVRKALGVGEPGYLGEWHAVRQYATNVTGSAAHRLWVWFEPDILPGYVWSFPLPGGRANVGYGVPRSDLRHGKQLKALWPALLERPHIAAALGPGVTLEDRSTAWPIPAGIDRATLSSGRTLFVGDAAMATDVMTGEGIGQALLTGRLAAEAIIEGGALRPEAVAGRYAGEVRHHLVADHRMSALLGRALVHPLLARGAVRLVGVSGWTRRNFARWMFEDEARAVVFTPRRWHRQFLRRPGPYR
jgi:geranylgeranyl reductase family protein